MPMRRGAIPAAERLGLSRTEAAEYVGVSPYLFDLMVDDGRMPPPKCINARRVWSRPALEAAFADLPEVGSAPLDAPPPPGDKWDNPAP